MSQTNYIIENWIESLEINFSTLSDTEQAFVELVRDEFDQWACISESSEKRLQQLYNEKVL